MGYGNFVGKYKVQHNTLQYAQVAYGLLGSNAQSISHTFGILLFILYFSPIVSIIFYCFILS